MQKGFAIPLVVFFSLVILVLITGFSNVIKLNKKSSEDSTKAASLYTPKILLLIYNPIIESAGGQKLTQVKGWNDPDQLTSTLFNTFSNVSGLGVNYQIAETVEIDGFPVKIDGFQFTDETYLNCVNGGGKKCHSPDGANYNLMIDAVDACGKRNRGEIDELWIWGGPWFGYWESNLAGSGAFWYNSSPTTGTTCEKLLPIMGFNYERGEAEALESYGHRAESTMIKVYGSWEPQETHVWNRFTLLDKDVRGRGGCGNAHTAVNGLSDYDRTNTRTVPSSCEDFLSYPNMTGTFNDINCAAWGCDGLSYLKWWYSHMPKQDGVGSDGKLANWWAYFVDPQNTIVNATPIPSTPTPTPAPNRPPVISTSTLPQAKVGRHYSEKVKGYDLDTQDTLSMEISGLPLDLSVGKCSSSIVSDRKEISCTVAGRVRDVAKTYSVAVTLRDNRGGIVQTTLLLVVNP